MLKVATSSFLRNWPLSFTSQLRSVFVYRERRFFFVASISWWLVISIGQKEKSHALPIKLKAETYSRSSSRSMTFFGSFGVASAFFASQHRPTLAQRNCLLFRHRLTEYLISIRDYLIGDFISRLALPLAKLPHVSTHIPVHLRQWLNYPRAFSFFFFHSSF